MKGTFARILSMLLVLSLIVSMFSIFAFAETEGDADVTVTDDGVEAKDPLEAVKEKYPAFKLLYQRAYDEGWDTKNGMSYVDRGSDFYIDYEIGSGYNYNYFMRMEIGSNQNSYSQWEMGSTYGVGTVIEFDLKADDYCNFPNFLYACTPGGTSADRENPYLITIKDSKLYVLDRYEKRNSHFQAEPVCTLSNEWSHFAIIMDYTYSSFPELDEDGNQVYDEDGNPVYKEDPGYFECRIYYAPTEEYRESGELELVSTIELYGKESSVIDTDGRTVKGAKGVNYYRFQVANAMPVSDYGSSICMDNLVAYTGATEYGLATPEMGYGANVSEGYAKNVEIIGGSTGAKNAYTYIDEGLAMKVNVNYMRANSERTPIFEDENGNAYGAPIKVNGSVFVPLEAILKHIDYPYYIHKDGEFMDISTGTSASYITIGGRSATVEGNRVELNNAPGYYNDVLYVDYRDFATIIPGWYADYDEMGFIAITTKEDVVNRDKDLNTMVDIMKEFVFDYVTPEQVLADVEEHTNGFDHPYLLGDQEEFDWLSSIYNNEAEVGTYDPNLHSYLEKMVSNAENAFTRYAKWSHSYVRVEQNYEVGENGLPVFYPILDADGNPIMTPQLDDDGNEVLGEDGNPIMVPSVAMKYFQKYRFFNASGSVVSNLLILEGTGEISAIDGTAVYLVTADENGNFDVSTKVLVENRWELPSDVIFNMYDRKWIDYVGLMTDKEQLEYYGASGYVNYSLEMPYQESYGYDPEGGRSALSNRSQYLERLGMGWQLTRDIRYVIYGFDVALELAEWKHWGPGHFLNCADGVAPIAYYYDWCYDAIMAIYNGTDDMDGDGEADFDMSIVDEYLELTKRTYEHFDINRIYEPIYQKAVFEGTNSARRIATEFLSPIVGAGGNDYQTKTNNWVAVCCSGMILASLCLIDQSDDENLSEWHQFIVSESAWLISDQIWELTDHGMGQYVPDGSYIEGPGYWSYGTNNFFELCMALDSAAGQNYGLMDCWGIDTTCDFACQTESSDYRTFNFHDGSMSSQDTSMFFYAGQYLKNDGYISVRLNHLAGGKGVTFFDLLSYPRGDVGEVEPMALDYFAENLDIHTVRSSWEPGALFAGMMGGYNHITHGQTDAGSFVYHNQGKVWFIDLGTENYNCYGFWGGASRYRYYKMKPEGNNTIAIASEPELLPYGQEPNAGSKMIQYGANEHGSYSIQDMTDTLNGVALSWYRGMMVTNDRKTTIIQDEMNFAAAQDIYWFGHYSFSYVTKVELSDDRRTAYMISGTNPETQKILRVRLISGVTDMKFEIWDCYTFLNNDPNTGTFGPEYAANNGNRVPEGSRANFNKLVIHGDNLIKFQVAVVIEAIDPQTKGTPNEITIGYEYDPSKGETMLNWEPYRDARNDPPTEEELVTPTRGRQNPAIIPGNISRIERYFNDGTAFTSNIDSIYYSITELEYVIGFFRTDPILNRYSEQVDQFDEYKATYDAYVNAVNAVLAERNALAQMFMGM